MRTENQVTHSERENERSRAGNLGLRHGIKHILVCLDGSPGSAICIAYALSLADTFDSAVTLMHVLQHHDNRFVPHTTDALDWEISRQEAMARLEQLKKEAASTSGRKIGLRLEQGRPAERIVALSRELGADLVVLGSHDQSHHPSWDLGSTAQQVLAAARSSVLIARGSTEPPTFNRPTRILVPLDGSLRAESVLPTVGSIASAHRARLKLIHVVAEPTPSRVLAAPEDLRVARDLARRLEAQATQYLEATRHHMGYDESLVDTHVDRQIDRRQFLLELSVRERVDLIVLSAHGRTCNVERPFGSVTEHFLTYSKVPILILQDVPRSELQSGDSDERRAPPLRGSFPPENV